MVSPERKIPEIEGSLTRWQHRLQAVFHIVWRINPAPVSGGEASLQS
jgi:hypothetical protein